MKKKYDIALFDLDGTLSESGEGILECVRSIFEEMNRPLPDEKMIASFIGPPIYESLKRCGFCHEDAEKGVEIYRKNFVKTGIYKNRVYQGIFGVLEALKNAGGSRQGSSCIPFTSERIKNVSAHETGIAGRSKKTIGSTCENQQMEDLCHGPVSDRRGSDVHGLCRHSAPNCGRSDRNCTDRSRSCLCSHL